MTGYYRKLTLQKFNFMINDYGFPPIASENANVLILGSMPSVASLRSRQYYAHPRNAFWPIMAALFEADIELSYQQRQQIIMNNNIAIWDVLQSCHRPGSLDAKIDMASIQANDFTAFFAEHKSIHQVFFNGGMAEKLFKQYILPVIDRQFSHLEYQRLPSTSPAYASLRLEQKINAWRVIKQSMVK